jgi:hypothetical protein
MTDDWRLALNDDQLAGAVLVDFSKAFDMVSHNLLLRKLSLFGINGMSLQLFQSNLNGRQQRVCIGTEKSSWVPSVEYHKDRF